MTSRCAILGLALLACAGLARAEMHALDDDQLSDIQGGALGIVLDGLLVDGEYYPQDAVRRAPTGLRVEQTLGKTATPSRTIMGLRRHLGCWWVTL